MGNTPHRASCPHHHYASRFYTQTSESVGQYHRISQQELLNVMIGGAERLVVDAALGLQKLGHSVDVYTSHHDPSHCFEETRDGEYFVCDKPVDLC